MTALVKASQLGIDPITEPENMKVRVAPSFETAKIDVCECPLGSLELSARDEENSLPSISVDVESPITHKRLSSHVMRNIGNVSNAAKL